MRALRWGVLGLVLSTTAPSHAYVRSRTTHGTVTAWRSNCIMVQPDSVGTADLPAATLTSVIQASLQAWTMATMGCSYLALNYVAPAPLDAHYDGINTIKFRSDKWCHPDDAKSNSICYSKAAAGITTIYYVDSPGHEADGSMLDADVELNNINFTFAVVDPAAPTSIMPRAGTSLADLANTLVHEIGHLQGLDHTCADAATSPTALDDTGMKPTACSALATLAPDARTRIRDATMFNSADAGETKKRTPEADDVAGICNAYPTAMKPAACSPADLSGFGGGCDIGYGTGGGSLMRALVLGLLLSLFALLRRCDWRAPPSTGSLGRPDKLSR